MSNWKEEILSDHIGLRHGYQFRETDFTENGIQVIKIGNVTDDGLNLDATVSYVSSNRIHEFENITLKEGDILMSLTGNIGRVVEVNKLGNLFLFQNYRVGVFYPLNENIYKPFIKWILSSDDLLRQLNSHSNQSAQANFGKQDLDKLKFKIPSIPEQRQIATILSTADAVIEKTQAAITKYKAIKQGMLQDLFTRGIDATTGKLRPSYQDAPESYKESKLGWIPKEWEVDNFEGASELITDFTANGSFESLRLNVKYYYTIEYARLIRLTDLRVNLDNDGVFVDKEGYEFLSKSTLYENDILLANVGEYTGFACLMPKVNYPATIAPNMFLIRCNKTIFNSIFMYYFMTLDAFTRQVDNVSASSATKLLNKTNFRTLSIHKPSVIEQEKIGNFLKAIDQKLKTEEDFLQKHQQIKAGLMNDLLSGRKKVFINEE